MSSAIPTLSWITAEEIARYKYHNQRVEVLLYSAQSCLVCQSKLIPIFDELHRWPLSQWRAMGLRLNSRGIRLSALDTSRCSRPNIAEVKGVVTVPYVQMWAPSDYEYEPITLNLNFEYLTYDEVRQRLVEWIVKHVNEID